MIKFKLVVAKLETKMVTGIISMLLLAQVIEISNMPCDIPFKLQNIISTYRAFRKYSDSLHFFHISQPYQNQNQNQNQNQKNFICPLQRAVEIRL